MKKPFKILGVQQIAIGGKQMSDHLPLWETLFELPRQKTFESANENVREIILGLGEGDSKVEIDIMEPIDPSMSPDVSKVALNHIGLWVDDLKTAFDFLSNKGVHFTEGGIRKGAIGQEVCFIHPKGNSEFPISGNGVLIELVQVTEGFLREE